MDFGWSSSRYNHSNVDAENEDKEDRQSTTTTSSESEPADGKGLGQLWLEKMQAQRSWVNSSDASTKGLFRDSHYLASDGDSSQSVSDSSEDDECEDDDAAAGSDDTMKMNEHDLRKLSNKQLKNKLKNLGLKVSGNKGELIDRL